MGGGGGCVKKDYVRVANITSANSHTARVTLELFRCSLMLSDPYSDAL